MTAMGGTHHLPFVFRSPNKRPVNDSGTVIVTDQRIRFCQSWRFVFRLTREGNPTEVFSQQEFTIRLIGETIIVSNISLYILSYCFHVYAGETRAGIIRVPITHFRCVFIKMPR